MKFTGNASWGVGPNTEADVKSAYNVAPTQRGFRKKFYRQFCVDTK